MPTIAPNPESREAIAERLRLTREAFGMSNGQWAARLGIAQNAWSNYEGGARRISIDEAFKLARAMRLTLDWIYRGETYGLPADFLERLAKAQQSQEPERLRA